MLELVRFAARANQLRRAVTFRPELSALTQLGPHVPARWKSPRQRSATASGLRPHRAGLPHFVAQEPCLDPLLALSALYSARFDYPPSLSAASILTPVLKRINE